MNINNFDSCQALSEVYPEICDKVASHFKCDIKDIVIRKIFGEGKSGDEVLQIVVKSAASFDKIGEYILKISKNSKDDFLKEIENTHRVYNDDQNKFIKIPHLETFSVTEPFFYVYDVAGNDLIEASKLGSLLIRKKADRLYDISYYLLTLWNTNIVSEESTIKNIIMEWLGENRLKEGSRLNNVVAKLIGDELAMCFKYDEKTLPNPIYFLSISGGVLSQNQALLQSTIYGKFHGDMNANNIIVQPLGKKQGFLYYIIDFEQYRDKAPLFFDNAYLLLSILLDEPSITGLAEWNKSVVNFFASLIGESPIDNSNEPFPLYVRKSNEAIELFFHQNQSHNLKTAKLQYLAAHVAAGLNFVNKRNANERLQTFAFLYAAVALSMLFCVLNCNCIFDNEKIGIPALGGGKKSNRENIWNDLDGFAPENRYILITSCLEENISVDCLLNYMPIHWTSIIEINDKFNNPVRTSVLSEYQKIQGYRFVSIPCEEEYNYESVPTWVQLCIPGEQSNSWLYFRKKINTKFENVLKNVLKKGENETLYILLQADGIDSKISNHIIEDIIDKAGDNTSVHVVVFGESDLEIESDEMIKTVKADCTFAELGEDVYALMEHIYDKDEVHVPSKDGITRISSQMLADLKNDITLVHRNIISSQKDDNGSSFYRGGEATWHDIASERDCKRTNYIEVWRELIKNKLAQIASGSSSVFYLYHQPGGGGSTLSKRIAWDFCIYYPTVLLHTISDQTSERLKKLYGKCIKPLLIIVEVSDGRISFENIQQLRRSLLSKELRALFICVSRVTNIPKHDETRMILPDTSDMFMNRDEAMKMCESFKSRLDENDKNDAQRIAELIELVNEPRRDLLCPFFFGLYAYGKDYTGISNYISHSCQSIDNNGIYLLKVLAIITLFSQTINLELKECALFLFLGSQANGKKEEVKEWLSNNPLTVRRENGFRICHPIIAEEFLKQQCDIDLSNDNGKNTVVKIVCNFIDEFVSFYGEASERVNIVFREIFTHREVIDEDEQKKFSPLITALETRERCVELLLHLHNRLPASPHYSNHLARAYLYSVKFNPQGGDIPNIEEATKYANEAIQCAKNNNESTAIHYHTLGKVYTQECAKTIKVSLRRRCGMPKIVKELLPVYKRACAAFDMCIENDNSGYGLTGKLELISKILKSINFSKDYTIDDLVRRDLETARFFSNIIAEAGNLITRYLNMFDDINSVFQRARINFYTVIGDLKKVENVLTSVDSGKMAVNTRRAIVTLLMKDDIMDVDKLRQVFNLLDKNIKSEMQISRYDRIRWLETYRKLDDFSLQKAYSFLLEWTTADTDLYVCYYRYVVSFALYLEEGLVNYDEVLKHLVQCENVSRTAYGKRVTSTRDFLGKSDNLDRDILLHLLERNDDIDRIAREERNRLYRAENCRQLDGYVSRIDDGIVTVRFSFEDNPNKSFEAKTPISGITGEINEGTQIKFYLGFSYAGLRVWDAVPYNGSLDKGTLT